MTKRKVTLLTLLMALSLVGIMALQFVWMRKAFLVRNELFDRSVNEALVRSSNQLETYSDVFMVHDIMVPPPPPLPIGVPNYNANRLPIRHSELKKNFVVRNDTLIDENSDEKGEGLRRQIKITGIHKANSGTNQYTFKIDEADSVLENIEQKIDHQVTVMFDNRIKNQLPDSNEQVISKEWEKKIGKKVERLKNVAGQMVHETWNFDTEILPDTALLHSILDKELSVRGIPIGYEFGLIRSDKVISKSLGYDTLTDPLLTYRTELFPNAIFNKNDLLSVYFPGRNVFLIKTLLLPASLSLLFCIIIMWTFALSIYYIIRQKKVSEMKSDFINNMTHEFKTPLATISVATDSIVNPKVIGNPDQITNYTSIIRKENLRMNQHIETILQIARLDQKDFDFQFRITNIHELIEKAVQGITLQVESRNGSITIEKNASNPMVTADPAHALNMFNNLLDNANKYSPELPEIHLSTRNSDRGVWISVSDRGIGMSKQVQHKIFEKFYRESTGNIHNVKGFGLGLSYVKAVVDANKGEIRVISEPGKGSTFEVFLPFTLII